MGIVHHATYLAYFEVGRVGWLRQRNLTFASFNDRGVHVAVVDARVLYRAPSRFDDLLLVETTLSKLGAVSIDYTYRIVRDETLIAEGSTRLACIDAHHKLLRLPADIRSSLLEGEAALAPS